MPSSREEFKEYCLRKLGKPVIVINVDDTQVEDRISEAVQIWQEKHFDATEKEWVAYKITQDDVDNGFIRVPDNIHVIDKMIPASILFGGSQEDGVFGFKYQFMLTNMSPFQPLDMINYYMTMTNINEVNDLVNTVERFEHTKHKNKLVIHRGKEFMKVDMVVCFHVHKYLDEDLDSDMWDDKWLKQYTTALIKQQWGQNMLKHTDIQLLGGVTINGRELFDTATQELEKLEEQLRDTYEEPVSFFLG